MANKAAGQAESGSTSDDIYYTARHLLQALQNLDPNLLDSPVLLVHGKDLHKPNMIHGFIPALMPVKLEVVEAKSPSLLTLASFSKSTLNSATTQG